MRLTLYKIGAMVRDKIKNTNIYKNMIILKMLLKIMGVKPVYFIVQTFSSFLIAFLEGLSLGLLAPLAKGIIDKNFIFLERVPVFKIIIAHFPRLLTETPYTVLFVSVVVIIFITVLIKNILEYLFKLHLFNNQERFSVNIQTFVFNRYLSFGKLFFDRTSQGYIRKVLRFASETTSLLNIISRAMGNLFTLVVYLTIMFIISWRLTIFFICAFPILYISVRWIIKKIKWIAQLQTEASLRMSQELFNIFSSIVLIKAYNKEEETKRRFSEISNELKKLKCSLEKKYSLLDPPQKIVATLFLLLLISAVGFLFMKTGTTKVPQYLVFILLARRAMPSFANFNNIRASLKRIEPPIKKVLEVLDNRGKFFIPEGDRVFNGLKRSIEFRNTNFSYHQKIPVLKNMSFSIDKGKMTAIVGPTGAGKTTIISLIMRFYDCAPSTIFIDDVDIRKFTIKSLRNRMALVDQDVLIFSNTIRNNIMFGIDGSTSEKQLIDVVKKARLYNFIMKLPKGFDTEVGDRGVKLSGGEKQRVSISRALLKDPEILILDEATSSLDTSTERLIQKAIEEAIRGRTTVVIAHRLSTIKHANKIIVIGDGIPVEEGNLSELLAKKGKFYQYWEEQKFY